VALAALLVPVLVGGQCGARTSAEALGAEVATPEAAYAEFNGWERRPWYNALP
jgi:hypothetical protein